MSGSNKSSVRVVAEVRVRGLAWIMKMSSTKPTRVPTQKVRTYADLQLQIREDLRSQHPEWIDPNGNSPICDSYERRLAELIGFFQFREHDLRGRDFGSPN